METVKYHVPAISCSHCVATIRREVGELEGVTAVEADVQSKEVRVDFRPPANEIKIAALLEEIGYPAQR